MHDLPEGLTGTLAVLGRRTDMKGIVPDGTCDDAPRLRL